jgi:uncharacterized membrane protein YeiH
MEPPFMNDAVTVPVYLDLTAVLLGGLAGSLRGVSRKFSITGVIALAIAAGLGGGILRDVLLQNGPPLALTNPSYLPVCLGAAAIGFFFGSIVNRFGKLILVMDAIWLGLYAVVGAEKALLLDFSPFSAILVGAIAATGGSVLMDVLSGEQPELVRPGPIGHFGALVGAVLYVILADTLSMAGMLAMIITIIVVFAIRVTALRFGIQAPTPVDLPQTITEVAHKSRKKVRTRKAKQKSGLDSGEASPCGGFQPSWKDEAGERPPDVHE